MQKPTITLTQDRYKGRAVYGLCISFENGRSQTFRCVSFFRPEAERLRARLSGADVSALHYADIVCDSLVERFFELLEFNGLNGRSL